MHCEYCGFSNGEEDHRCLQCGRRLQGVVIAAPPGYVGANALAFAPAESADPAPDRDLREMPPAPRATKPAAAKLTAPQQDSLFSPATEKIIPFEKFTRRTPPRPMPQAPHVGPPTTISQRPVVKPATRGRSQGSAVEQGVLDFIPALPLQARMLKTEVEAQVFCEQPVATPTHRFVAAVIDAAIIVSAFVVLLVAYQLIGGRFGSGKMFWIGLGSAFSLVALAYGLLWAIAGRETAGMAMTDLQLITFDGFQLDARSRALRFVTSWLSFCSGGLGLLWALADEESLTWHDHISKTFPAVKDADAAFVRQRR